MKKLFIAIRQNDIEKVAKILDKNPETVNSMAIAPPKKDDGQSPLQVSIKTGNLTIAQYLIEKGADVNYMEPDNGLPPNKSYRCPVLFDAITRVFFEMRISHYSGFNTGYIELLLQLFKLGADPNKRDNRGWNSWTRMVNSFIADLHDIKDQSNRDILIEITNKLLSLLIEYGVNIYEFEDELGWFVEYSLLVKNLMLNKDIFWGVAEEEKKRWAEYWIPAMEILKPYYSKNNPYYGGSVTKDNKIFFKKLAQEIAVDSPKIVGNEKPM